MWKGESPRPPEFMRATISAAMDSAGPFEQHATRAFYYITPPDAGMAAEKLEDYLHVHYFAGRQLILAHAQSTAEGWAHYAEQMMIDEGLGQGDPTMRVAQLEEALLRD